jgi:hypothetical protein
MARVPNSIGLATFNSSTARFESLRSNATAAGLWAAKFSGSTCPEAGIVSLDSCADEFESIITADDAPTGSEPTPDEQLR